MGAADVSSAQAAHYYSRGKLLARPQPPAVAASRQQPKYGLHPLGIGPRRDGLVYTPETYSEAHDKAAPLIVMLHGAGGNASGAVKFMSDYADEVSLADWSCNHCTLPVAFIPLATGLLHPLMSPAPNMMF